MAEENQTESPDPIAGIDSGSGSPASEAEAKLSPADDLKATLEAARKAVEDSKARENRILSDSKRREDQLIKTVQVIAAGNQREEEPEEDEFVDVDEKTKKLIAREVQRAEKKLGEAYQRDRQGDFSYRSGIERERIESRFPDLSKDQDLKKTFDEILSNQPSEIRAAPQILDEAYFLARGKVSHQREAAETARQAASLSTSARTPGFIPGERRSFTQEERDFARRINPTMTQEDLEVLSNRGPISIDDYLAKKKRA